MPHFRLLPSLAATCLLLLIAIPAFAQDATRQTDRELMLYRVAHVEDQGDSIWAYLWFADYRNPGFIGHGLFEGGSGVARSVYQNAGREGGAAVELGRATTLLVSDSLVVVEVVLSDTSSAAMQLYVDDVVEVAADIPPLEERTVFFDLVQDEIQFLDINDDPILDWSTVLLHDGPALQDSLLTVLGRAVHETADMIRPLIPDNPQWDIDLVEGRFAGMKMVDAMSESDNEDVLNFLLFIKSYPGKYLGQDWRISETYATWLINAAPPGQDELKESLLESWETPEFDRLITQYADELADGIFTTNWNNEAEALGDEGKFDEAFLLTDIVERIAIHLSDDNMRGYMLFSRADVERSREEYESSVSMYEEAIALFQQTGDIRGESIAVNNLGNALDDLERYEEATATFEAAIELKNRRIADNPGLEIRTSLAASYFGLASAMNSTGNFVDALEAFRAADSLYLSEGSLNSQEWHLRVLREQGKIWLKLDNKEEAMAAFERSRDDAERLGNDEAQADAWDEIGYALDDDQASLEAYQRAHELHMKAGYLSDAGFSKSQMGQTLWRLGRLEDAIASHREAIALREEVGFKSGQAYSWLKLGSLYKKVGDPNSAIEAYDTAASLYDSVGNRSGAADVLEDLGDLFIEEEDYTRAAETHLSALEIRESLGLTYEVGTSLNDVANAYYHQQDYESSKHWYERAVDTRREIGDQSGLIYSLANLGNLAYFHDRDYERAIEILEEALAGGQALDNRYLQGYVLSKLGDVASDAGRNQEALVYERNALPLFSDIDDIVDSHNAIGYVLESLGRLDEAESEFVTARDKAREAESRRDESNALRALSGLYVTTGRIGEAMQLANQSLRMAEEVDNTWGRASAHNMIGNIFAARSANQLAILQYQISDSLYVVAGSESSRSVPQHNIGDIHLDQGDYERALPYFQKTLEAQESNRLATANTVTVLQNLGHTYEGLEDWEAAESWFNRALEMAEQIGADLSVAGVRLALGDLMLESDREDESFASFEAALETARTSGSPSIEAGALMGLGKAYLKTGDLEPATANARAGIDIFRSMSLTAPLSESLFILGQIDRLSGRLDESETNLREAVQMIERMSLQLAFGESAKDTFAQSGDRLETYEELVSVLIEQGKTEEALQLIERTSLEAIRNNLAGLTIEFENPEMTAALEDDRRRKRELAELDRQIVEQKEKGGAARQEELIEALEQRREVLSREYIAFVEGTVREYPELDKHLTDSVNPGDFNRARRAIPENTAVLAYLVGNENTFIFTATRDSVGAVAIPVSSSLINELVNGVHRGVSQAGTGALRGLDDANESDDDVDVSSALADLYRLLIEPIEAEIAGKTNLAVIPSGSLHKLPFQILSDSEAGKAPLLASHTIFYTSKLDVFFFPPMGGGVEIVAFGDADETLDWAEREVNEIARVHPDTRVFVKGEATESRVKQVSPDHNILHLATHGTLDYNNFENSFLTLAPDAEGAEDGQLTIGEIWNIAGLENYRLVTLSACETAVNDDIANGWPISPANAFLNHVPSVIASLWKVDDVATSLLMQRFYENLESMGTAEALQMAQLTLSQDENYADPFYWAPFVVMGDWR